MFIPDQCGSVDRTLARTQRVVGSIPGQGQGNLVAGLFPGHSQGVLCAGGNQLM